MNAQTRIQRLLEDVLRQPGNERCADCHASSPRWASTNLGIFLCVQCASLHRRLGTHTSRVKSVTLDEWTRDQVAHMRAVGNTRSNAVFNPDERRNPPPLHAAEERDSELFKYIRRKYELGAFKAGAAPALAQRPVNSRAIAQQARSVSGASGVSSVSNASAASAASARSGSGSGSGASTPAYAGAGGGARRPELADIVVSRDRDLPPLPSPSKAAAAQPPTTVAAASAAAVGGGGLAPPPAPARARAPTWSGEGGLAPPRPTPVRSSSANALRNESLLVDTRGSASATRPLQLNSVGGFPTVPYASSPGGGLAGGGLGGSGGMNLQPPNATPAFAPLASPAYPAPSPLALGQQAFHFPPPQQAQQQQQQQTQQFAANNPFGAQGAYAYGAFGSVSPLPTGMSGQMGMVSNGVPSGMANGVPNGMPNGMGNGMPNGVGMNGHMGNGAYGPMGGPGGQPGMNGAYAFGNGYA